MRWPGKPRIVLLTGNSLCHNPRAVKEASALARAGYDVRVLGAWLEPSLKTRDLRLMEDLSFEFIPVFDVTSSGPREEIARLTRRTLRRVAQIAYDLAGLESSVQLGVVVRHLLRQVLKIPAALYIAHSEPCLYVACKLLQRGCRVGVDMEDWFSEDLLPEARRHRPLRLLRSLEQELLQRGAYASCPSRAMSVALAGEYGCAEPTVIYNAFPWADRQALDGAIKDRRNREIPSLHWYSATLGPGRGLKDLLAATAFLKHDLEIHLRGNPSPGFAEWLWTHVPDRQRERLWLHPLVANDQLLPRIAEHDIGFAGEIPICRNRDLTITNKMLHYLLGGLAVVASNTEGQREVASQIQDGVQLYPSGNPRALADILNQLVASPEVMQRAKSASLAAAQRRFCWERWESALIDGVARALDGPVRRLDAGLPQSAANFECTS